MLKDLFSFDSGSVIFWSITYILIIIRGFKKDTLLIPYLNIYLNLGWEICSIYNNASWKNWFWFLLDSIIFVLMIKRIRKSVSAEKQSLRTNLSIVCLTLCVTAFAIIFSRVENGMLLSSFAIDIIMAAAFLITMLTSPQKGKSVPIAATKLIGDFCAWQYYRSYSPIINVIGIIVQILNSIYFIISLPPVYKQLIKLRNHSRILRDS